MIITKSFNLVRTSFNGNAWISYSYPEYFFSRLILKLYLKPLASFSPFCTLSFIATIVIPVPRWLAISWFNWNPNRYWISVCLVIIWVINHVLNTENVSKTDFEISSSCHTYLKSLYGTTNSILSDSIWFAVHWSIVTRTITDIALWQAFCSCTFNHSF